jgi:predicted site-specific integrase-resolvase
MLAEQTRLLNRVEAAEFLGVKPQTLAIWATTGRYSLPLIKVGRLAKYRLSDLERFLERRTIGATE